MATLLKGTRAITVPDSLASDYEADGWALAGSAPPAEATPAKRKPKAKAVKHGVPVRANSDEGSA